MVVSRRYFQQVSRFYAPACDGLATYSYNGDYGLLMFYPAPLARDVCTTVVASPLDAGLPVDNALQASELEVVAFGALGRGRFGA